MRIYAIEQMGRLGEAARLYLAIPAERDNYFGNRATLRLRAMAATEAGRRVIAPLARGYRDQARAALQSGRYSEAKDAATQALRLTEDTNEQRDLLAILRASYSQIPAYNVGSRFRLINAARAFIAPSEQATADASHTALAAELLFLGLYDEGIPRASDETGDDDAVRPAPAATGDAAYTMAVYSNRGDQGWHAIKFGESMARTIPQDYRLELLPRDLAELIYPAPYRDLLNRYAGKNGIDSRLVLSLARQESRFNPSVKSGAAARGLLQFINETALRLAEQEGMKNFELDDVYEPEVAIRLAAREVANLLKQFPDNPYAVAASYNTYDTNVERWIFRSRSTDIDRFTVEVALPETKDYVAKVMNNYWAYQQLYNRDLNPRRQ
jgi:soluble lytic murein transglycosylase